jgi:hypothetical protein
MNTHSYFSIISLACQVSTHEDVLISVALCCKAIKEFEMPVTEAEIIRPRPMGDTRASCLLVVYTMALARDLVESKLKENKLERIG